MPPFLLAFLTNPRVWLAVGVSALAIAAGAYVMHLERALATARQQAAVAHAQAVVATGQAEATQDAQAIQSAGSQRDSLAITLHEANDHALQSTPGASDPVAAAVNAAGRRGLCGYAAYANDPGCAGLRVADPAQLPQSHTADAPSAR